MPFSQGDVQGMLQLRIIFFDPRTDIMHEMQMIMNEHELFLRHRLIGRLIGMLGIRVGKEEGDYFDRGILGDMALAFSIFTMSV